MMQYYSRLLAIAAASSALVLTGCEFRGFETFGLPGTVGGGANSYEVTIEFDDASTLALYAPVKVNNVTVGTVTEKELNGWDASLTASIKPGVSLPDNATAKIGQKSLLGSKYLALSPPRHDPPKGRLEDGDVIRMTRTSSFPETEQVLSAISMLLNGGGLSQLQTITSELNAAFSGNEQEIRDLLDEVHTLVGGLENEKTDVVRALEGLDQLSTRLAEQRATIGEAVETIEPTLEVLNTEQADITQLLVALGELSDVGTRVIRATRGDTLATLQDLQPILARLADAGDALIGSLTYGLTPPFSIETAQHAVQGDYLNLFITLDLTLPTLQREYLGGTPLEDAPALETPSPVALDPLLRSLAPTRARTKVGSATRVPRHTDQTSRPPFDSREPDASFPIDSLLGGGS